MEEPWRAKLAAPPLRLLIPGLAMPADVSVQAQSPLSAYARTTTPAEPYGSLIAFALPADRQLPFVAHRLTVRRENPEVASMSNRDVALAQPRGGRGPPPAPPPHRSGPGHRPTRRTRRRPPSPGPVRRWAG